MHYSGIASSSWGGAVPDLYSWRRAVSQKALLGGHAESNRFNPMLMLCPICAGEFDSRDKSCRHCGCALVPSALNADARASVATVNKGPLEFVELCRPQSSPIALMIKETLEQNGVAAAVQGGHALSLQPHLAFGGQLRVLVDASQIEFAREVYRSFFESDDDIDYVHEE